MAKREKYITEFSMKCSPAILYEFLATTSGLSEWFADKVTEKGDEYHFEWNGNKEIARLIATEENEYVVYQWDWMDEDEYVEFRIEKSPVTNETLLTITDFADSKEMEDQRRLWETQIHDLKHRIGS